MVLFWKVKVAGRWKKDEKKEKFKITSLHYIKEKMKPLRRDS